MNEVGRPTSEELDRMEELVDEYFVGDSWATEIRCWDDGDVHINAYSTLGTNYDDGYPVEVRYHRQNILYKREDNECFYKNVVELMTSSRPKMELNRIEIDWDNE